jgi:hypothetical protein
MNEAKEEKKEKKREKTKNPYMKGGNFDDEIAGKTVRVKLITGEIFQGKCATSQYFIKIMQNPPIYITKGSIAYIQVIGS